MPGVMRERTAKTEVDPAYRDVAESIFSALAAWPCAVLPPCVGLQVSAGGLLAAAAVDLALFRTCSSLPAWYIWGARVPLTAVAVGSLGACLAAEGEEGGAKKGAGPE